MTPAERATKCVAHLVTEFGPGIVAQSSVHDGLAERLAMPGKRWRRGIEIGTLRGVGAVVLAHFCETVITIDVESRPEVDAVLRATGRDIRQRVAPVIVPDNDAKAALVHALSFDVAFVDAGHSELQVRIDFDLCRRCGEILFHDYPASGSGCNGPGLVLNDLRAQGIGVVDPSPPFAWWRAE